MDKIEWFLMHLRWLIAIIILPLVIIMLVFMFLVTYVSHEIFDWIVDLKNKLRKKNGNRYS